MRQKVKKYWQIIRERTTVYDILILTLALAFLFFLRFYFKQQPTWVRVGLKVSSPHWWAQEVIPPYWLADQIEVGDQEIGFFNQKAAEVKDIQVFETSGERKDVYLSIDLRANYNSQTGRYTFKGQAVEIGSPLELHLGDVFVQGLITSVASSREELEEIVVTAEAEDKYPWQMENVNIGDQMKDGQDRVIAEIIDKQVSLADYLTSDWQGRVYLRKRPDKRDAIFKIKLKVTERKGNFYFRYEQKVKIGESLFLQFKNSELDYLNVIDIQK